MKNFFAPVSHSGGAERYLDALPGRADCTHVFSPSFEERMRPLLRRRKRRRAWRRILLLAAVVALLGTAVYAGQQEDYRVRATARDGILVYSARPQEDVPPQHFHRIVFGWLPEGYTLWSESALEEDTDYFSTSYRTRDYQYIALRQWMGREFSETLMGDYRWEGVTVRGSKGIFIDAAGGKTNYLPIRAVSELLGVEIGYDSATKTVLLGERTAASPASPAASTPASTATSAASTAPTVEELAEKAKWAEERKQATPLEPEYGITGGMFTEADPAEVDLDSWSGTADAWVQLRRPYTVGNRRFGSFTDVCLPVGKTQTRAFRIDPELPLENQLELYAVGFADEEIQLTVTAEQYRFGR